MLPIIEIYRQKARYKSYKTDGIYVWLIKYNGQIHEGGWANEDMAKAYADKLFEGKVEPKLLPKTVKV